MLHEHIERTSLQSMGLGSSRAAPDSRLPSLGRPVAGPLSRQHASLYMTTCIPLHYDCPRGLLVEDECAQGNRSLVRKMSNPAPLH
jgi:hypothetical protein